MLIKTALQYLIPQHLISRLAAKLANCRITWFKNLFIDYFIKINHIDLQDAVDGNPHNYLTFNDFFTRQLKPTARPIASEKNAIISPVDGVVLQFGAIQTNQLINAKGFDFTLTQLLGDETDAAKFINGHFAVIYLAPHNYHRIHMPCAGKLQSMTYIPGALFSVNPKITAAIPNVLARNERVVNIFASDAGLMGVVLVGAMIVGSIETAWAGTVVPNLNSTITAWNYVDKNIALEKGAELGKFKLGSTVILLFPEKSLSWHSKMGVNVAVKMGEIIANYI